MGNSPTLEQIGDNVLQEINVDDFSRGQLSDVDPLDCPLNGSPECRNVMGSIIPGSLIQRDGWIVKATALVSDVDADGIHWFEDSAGNQVTVFWQNGNLYNSSTGTAVLVASGVYAAGNQIAFVVRDNILYYSDGETTYAPDSVGMRQYNPATGSEGAVTYSAGAGRIPAPAAKCLALYNGAIIAGATTASGTFEPHGVRWSDSDFPTLWLASDIFQVGKGRGEVNALVPFALSTESLSPANMIFVGKTFGVFGLAGPLSDLEEKRINLPIGLKDTASAAFLPPRDGDGTGAGTVAFLATDKQVYETNGITARVISAEIRKELRDYITDQIALDTAARFTSVVYTKNYFYILDVGGGRQYAFDYQKRSWWPFEGWPSGLWAEGEDALKQKILLCATRVNDDGDVFIAQCDAGLDDNGEQIVTYWDTPYMKGPPGDEYANNARHNILKRFSYCYLDVATDEGTFEVTATVSQGRGDSCSASKAIARATGLAARYDIDTYDSGAVYGDSLTINYPRYNLRLDLYKTHTNGATSRLEGKDIQLRIEQTVDKRWFQVNGFTLKYLERGMRRGETA